MNLRVRFALALAALAAAATVAATVTSYLSTSNRLHEELDAGLRVLGFDATRVWTNSGLEASCAGWQQKRDD